MGFQTYEKDLNPPIIFLDNEGTKLELFPLEELVVDLGGKIVKKAETVLWSGYSGYFQVLAGYYWEVAYANSWQFDENNMIIIE